MKFSSLENYRNYPTFVTLQSSKETIVENWLLNGTSAKQGVQTGNHVFVSGSSSTLIKSGDGNNVFKYVSLDGTITLSGNWQGGQATAANVDTVTYASPAKMGWYKRITSTGTSTYTPPSHWNNSNNIIHLIGGGGGGGSSEYIAANARAGSGGGGGGYARIQNYIVTTPGSTSISYTVGTGGNGSSSNGLTGASGGTTSIASLFFAGGGSGGGSSGGAGGTGSFPSGGGFTYFTSGTILNGGAGGSARSSATYSTSYRGAGGGGAAGPFGAGVAGQSPSSTGLSVISYGGANGGGTATQDTNEQSNFFGYTVNHGASNSTGIDIFGIGSGAGANGSTTGGGSFGRIYGGGGSGGRHLAGSTSFNSGGSGAQGAIIFVWNVPLEIVNTQFFLTL
jgi:hypothetical protein